MRSSIVARAASKRSGVFTRCIDEAVQELQLCYSRRVEGDVAGWWVSFRYKDPINFGLSQRCDKLKLIGHQTDPRLIGSPVRRYFYRVLPFSVNKIRVNNRNKNLETDNEKRLPRSICAHANRPLWRHTGVMERS